MSDTIYRQDAIDAMEGLPKYFDTTDTLCLDYADVLAVLSEHLPSAQPEPCEDAVSRKLMYELGATCMARRDENGELVALGSLDALPSAQPERKKGKWLFNNLNDGNGIVYHCSCCNWLTKHHHYAYCPNCGADMRGEYDG